MRITLSDAVNANNALGKLVRQGHKYPVDVAFRLYKLKKDLEEVEYFTLLRLEQVFGTAFGDKALTPEQEEAYAIMMSAEIEIDVRNLKIKEILSPDSEVLLDVPTMGSLLKLFPENDVGKT
ncbi:MAG: hypothetical protein LUD72_04530 [Bacteroidales bacterium]|nr:hypothetical protein [Bacteroidales bacterium]